MNLDEFKAIVLLNEQLELIPEELKQVEDSYHFLLSFARKKVIYGINTGFGPMAQYKISDEDVLNLQYNIIRSHSSGAGRPLDEIYVKAAMLCRYRTFIAGKSGVHPDTVLLLKEFINRGIYPCIPEHGSVGSSGDLVQLSHLALTLIGEGEVFYKGTKQNTAEVLKTENLSPLSMYLREGLALANGTAFMTGIGLVNLIYAEKLLQWSIITSALMNEIASSYDDFLSVELNHAKLHYGQQRIAQLMRQILGESQRMLNRQKELYEKETQETVFRHKVQPYYSLRCVPQILGPVLDELVNAENVLINELNSVDDNPIVDKDTKSVYHGGNFHGDYVAYEMDKLKTGITKLTMLAERQLNYLLHDKINGILPPFLNLGNLGLNYGLQGTQFTATSTTAECQTLSNPMYVHSIPNNNDNQDIVSMGTNAALITKQVIENSFQVISIHAIALVQAVDYLNIKEKLSPITGHFYTQIREIIPLFIQDTPKYKAIEQIVSLLKKENPPVEI
ncbi:MAG: aromatic amino acid ammonia-lyase [Bacteroidales bacterium]|nr:aromatic amino acid ammonia-lyase [Bacteroidales bacterium]